jgi:hypothetical protein
MHHDSIVSRRLLHPLRVLDRAPPDSQRLTSSGVISMTGMALPPPTSTGASFGAQQSRHAAVGLSTGFPVGDFVAPLHFGAFFPAFFCT